METNELRVFVAVAEELHFGRAANRMHLTQPPVSRIVRRLEAELGVELFERTTRAVLLTAAGAALLTPAREALAALERGHEAVAAAASGALGSVRIAHAGLSTQAPVAALVSRLGASNLHVDVRLTGSTYGSGSLQKVVTREADLAFGRWDEMPEELATHDIDLERLAVAVRADADFGQLPGPVRFAEFAAARFLTLPDDSLLVGRLGTLASAAGFAPVVSQVSTDTPGLLALVRAGVGVSLTIASLAEGPGVEGISFHRLSEPSASVRLRAVWRRHDRRPALRAVVGALREEWPSRRA